MAIVKAVEGSESINFQKTTVSIGEKTLNGNKLKFTYCDLSDTNLRPYGNLFNSFNLPSTQTQSSDFNSKYINTSFSYFNNLTKIIVADIPQNEYGELIDGKTVKLTIPIISGNTLKNIDCYSTYFKGRSLDYNFLYSDPNNQSGYFGITPSTANTENSNIAYLFSNDISKPKTSILPISINDYNKNLTFTEINNTVILTGETLTTDNFYNFNFNLNSTNPKIFYGEVYIDSGLTITQPIYNIFDIDFNEFTWNNKSVKPNTNVYGIKINVDYDSLIIFGPKPTYVINSDIQKITIITSSWNKWSLDNKFPTKVAASYNDTTNNVLIDEPVGIVYLDKGFVVITHPSIVNNFNYSASTSSGFDGIVSGQSYTGNTNFTKVYFTDSNKANISYDSVVTEFIQNITAIAMPNEFYISSNPTFSDVYGTDGVNNIQNDPVYITEVGLYNSLGELIGIGKTSEPIPKNKDGIISFNIQIKL